jgi:hypothetical protein
MTQKTRLNPTNPTNSLPTRTQKGDERTNNDLQNTTQKTKDGATRTPLVAHPFCVLVGRLLVGFVGFNLVFCVMVGRFLVGFVSLNL